MVICDGYLTPAEFYEISEKQMKEPLHTEEVPFRHLLLRCAIIETETDYFKGI